MDLFGQKRRQRPKILVAALQTPAPLHTATITGLQQSSAHLASDISQFNL